MSLTSSAVPRSLFRGSEVALTREGPLLGLRTENFLEGEGDY